MAWRTLALEVDGGHAEPVADALEAAGAVSIDTSDADAGTEREQARFAEPGAESAPWRRCRLDALFPEGSDVVAIAMACLAEAGASAGATVAAGRLEDTDWVAASQKQFEPIKVTPRLWVVPTWHAAPDPQAINIVLDPGAAFGTGSHPTTRLMLEWLEDEITGGERVLDYGCGSGILAIAAMRLGASAATGVDIDPLALEAARYNSLQNDVEVEFFDAARQLDCAGPDRGQYPRQPAAHARPAHCRAYPPRRRSCACRHPRPAGRRGDRRLRRMVRPSRHRGRRRVGAVVGQALLAPRC
jgi:ribosomal protein L11 methyltransferase